MSQRSSRSPWAYFGVDDVFLSVSLDVAVATEVTDAVTEVTKTTEVDLRKTTVATQHRNEEAMSVYGICVGLHGNTEADELKRFQPTNVALSCVS